MVLQALATRGRFYQQPSSQRGMPWCRPARKGRCGRGGRCNAEGRFSLMVKILEMGRECFPGKLVTNKRETERHS